MSSIRNMCSEGHRISERARSFGCAQCARNKRRREEYAEGHSLFGRLRTAIHALKHIEWTYQHMGNREGNMCPVCYQFPPLTAKQKRNPRLNNDSWRAKCGHKASCWLGKAMKKIGRRV